MALEHDNTRTYANNRGVLVRHCGIRISASLAESLEAYAAEVGRTPSYVVRAAIAEFLRNRKGVRVSSDAMLPWITRD